MTVPSGKQERLAIIWPSGEIGVAPSDYDESKFVAWRDKHRADCAVVKVSVEFGAVVSPPTKPR